MLRCFCFVFVFFCFVHAVFQPGFHTFNENSIYWTSWYFPEFIVSHQQVHTSGRSALFSDSLPHFISEFTVNVTTLILVSLFSESFQWRQVFFSWIWWHDRKRQRPLEVTQGTTGFSDSSSLSLVSCPDLYLRGSPRWHRGSCSASTLERLFVAKLKRHFFHDILAFGKHWNIETFPTSSNLCLD